MVSETIPLHATRDAFAGGPKPSRAAGAPGAGRIDDNHHLHHQDDEQLWDRGLRRGDDAGCLALAEDEERARRTLRRGALSATWPRAGRSPSCLLRSRRECSPGWTFLDVGSVSARVISERQVREETTKSVGPAAMRICQAVRKEVDQLELGVGHARVWCGDAGERRGDWGGRGSVGDGSPVPAACPGDSGSHDHDHDRHYHDVLLIYCCKRTTWRD